MNMATIATEAVCGVVEAETAACLSPLGQPLFRQEARRHQRRRGRGRSVTADVRNPARGRRRTPAHHARSGRGTQHTQEPGRLREGREPGFNAHVANVVAAMFLATGQDEAQVVEGANAITTAEVQDGDRLLRLGLHRLPKSAPSAAARNPDAVRGPRYPRRQRRRRPCRLQRRRPRRMHRRRFPRGRTLPSPRSPRGTSPAPTPNSVGNCMGVVRPRFIGSEFVDPTLMNVLSREIPRDYEIPEYNAYHEHITKG